MVKDLLEALPLGFVLTVGGLLGLAVGSFLNVVARRVPAGESIVSPGSHCPACGRSIRWWNNLPVLSWLLLRGRCRDCGEAISFRYPLVELLGGAVAVASLWRFGIAWEALGSMLLGWHLLAISVIDLETGTVPDHLTLPLGLSGLALALLQGGWSGLGTALLSAAIGGGFFFLLGLVMRRALGREAMGGGDVTLLAAIGPFVHPMQLPFIVLVGGLAGLLGALLTAFATRRPLRRLAIPFAPALALGGWGIYMLGREGLGRLIGALLRLVGQF
jgi:leader peptidase (prepilin peptidase)/N-methyltransferase